MGEISVSSLDFGDIEEAFEAARDQLTAALARQETLDRGLAGDSWIMSLQMSVEYEAYAQAHDEIWSAATEAVDSEIRDLCLRIGDGLDSIFRREKIAALEDVIDQCSWAAMQINEVAQDQQLYEQDQHLWEWDEQAAGAYRRDFSGALPRAVNQHGAYLGAVAAAAVVELDTVLMAQYACRALPYALRDTLIGAGGSDRQSIATVLEITGAIATVGGMLTITTAVPGAIFTIVGFGALAGVKLLELNDRYDLAQTGPPEAPGAVEEANIGLDLDRSALPTDIRLATSAFVSDLSRLIDDRRSAAVEAIERQMGDALYLTTTGASIPVNLVPRINA